MSASVATFDRLDADRVATPEAPWVAARRRLSGRYPVDPFGLDPQIADFVTPLFSLAVRVAVYGGEHVPPRGPAVVVSNRGLGVAEPAALAVAVRRATGRRLRVVGAPSQPIVGAAARRLGAIARSDSDITAALHAGHLVGVPLARAWLRTDAGSAPNEIGSAMTIAPIVPAAVAPAGQFGNIVGSWRVRFGPIVTLPEMYEPNDPLAAARFAGAMREAVASLLDEE